MIWCGFWALVIGMGVTGLWASASSLRFARKVRAEVERLRSVPAAARPDAAPRREPLPPPVAVYLSRAVGDAPLARWVRFRHGGRFRTKLDGPWQPIAGAQYNVAEPPGFVWWGRLSPVPGFWIDARDRCVAGKGGMTVALESSILLFDRSGEQIDQGSMLRLLSDLVLLPWTLRDERFVSWEAVDDRQARATLRVGPTVVTGTFAFGADGLPSAFSADRFLDTGRGAPELLPWSGEYSDYRRVGGHLVPHHFVGYWHQAGRRIAYVDFRLETPEYDPESPYAGPPSPRRGAHVGRDPRED